MQIVKDFAYPLKQVPRAKDATFHNLVVQVLVLGLCLATLILELEKGEERALVAIKIVHVAAMIGAAVFTGATLALPHQPLHRTASLVSFGFAVAAVVVCTGTIASGTERAWWVELIVVLVGILWTWRTAQQSMRH